MGRWEQTVLRTSTMCVLSSGLLVIVGCSWLDVRSATPITPVSIERLEDVEGRWEGPVRAIQGHETSWVTVSITKHETYATYTFAGTGSGAPSLGTGIVQLLDGRLLTEGEGRTLTITLAEQGGGRVLVVAGIGKDGKSYHAELRRAKE